MRRPIIVCVLSTLLVTGSALAQTKPPAQQTPPPAQAQTPPAQAQPAPPPRPFPQGAKIAYVNIQMVASNSAQGKAYAARIQDLQRKKNDELAAKQKELQAAQQKLQEGQTVMSDTARTALEKDIDRMTREYQFLTQNAQAEVQDLQTELQGEFQKQLEPVIEKVAVSKDLYMVFSVGDSGLVWADRGLDITNEIIKEFDASAAKAPGGGKQ
jgi:outer membrane protein